jgi:hypothetical protein
MGRNQKAEGRKQKAVGRNRRRIGEGHDGESIEGFFSEKKILQAGHGGLGHKAVGLDSKAIPIRRDVKKVFLDGQHRLWIGGRGVSRARPWCGLGSGMSKAGDPSQRKSGNRRYTPMNADSVPRNTHDQNSLLSVTASSMPKC